MKEPRSITIIGATGTLGSALHEMIYQQWPTAHVTALSRDEHKQAAQKKIFPRSHFVIGDVRDENSLRAHVRNKDLVFHVAAMKHVDIIEANPVEAVKTNVLGTINVANACMQEGVRHMVYSSTDKAVDPINAYGYSKAISEKIILDLNQTQQRTIFAVYRWGNVIGSQGSAIPLFVNSLLKENRVFITHQDMTRFWLPIEWPVLFMLRSFASASLTDVMIPPVLKAASVVEVCRAIANILGINNYQTVVTGIRPGEKLHEVMHSQHSGRTLSSDTCERFTQSELEDLLIPFVTNNIKRLSA